MDTAEGAEFSFATRQEVEMDNARITIALEQCERAALMKLAQAELREPRDQARYIIRCELERRGLLPPTDEALTPETAKGEEVREADP